jgi:VCBS repeat-containing protein
VLTVFEVQVASRLGAAVSVNADGSVRYDPTASAVLAALAPGATRVDRFTYTVTDQQGSRATATVTVTVTGAAPAPSLTLLASEARSARRAATPEEAEEIVVDLAAEFAGFAAPAASSGVSSWQVGFVTEGAAPADPNRDMAVTIEMVA